MISHVNRYYASQRIRKESQRKEKYDDFVAETRLADLTNSAEKQREKNQRKNSSKKNFVMRLQFSRRILGLQTSSVLELPLLDSTEEGFFSTEMRQYNYVNATYCVRHESLRFLPVSCSKLKTTM